MEYMDYARVIWKYKLIIIALVVFGGTAGFMMHRTKPHVFEAKAKLLIYGRIRGNDSMTIDSSVGQTTIKVTDYAEIAKSLDFLREVAASLHGGDPNPAVVTNLKAHLIVQPIPLTNTIEISFRSIRPDEPKKVLDVLTTVLQRKSKELQIESINAALTAVREELARQEKAAAKISSLYDRRLTEVIITTLHQKDMELRLAATACLGEVEVIERAVAPTSPLPTRAIPIAAAAAFWGLIIGTGIAFSLDAWAKGRKAGVA